MNGFEILTYNVNTNSHISCHVINHIRLGPIVLEDMLPIATKLPLGKGEQSYLSNGWLSSW